MPHADPTLSVAERVDAACDHFESEWKAGRRPRIDDYLAAAPDSDREELRPALLAIQLELQGRGEADTSITRSSVRSDGGPTPTTTVDHIEGIENSRRAIGRFEIRAALGAGAFGKVYRAYDPHLGREVAVKVPLESTVKTDAERAQFLKEARAAATINHPNVCQVHEVGEADGRPYIVMALVPGQSLADTLKARKGPLPEKQAALIVRKIAVALAAAHDKGIVHRDLKPANVMFDRERKDIVVMDFGLARGPRFGDARGTQSGIVMGTPAYMSPEQARGESKEVGPAGDVFSLGVILYELLTGARPFSGTATEVIGQILHVDPEPPSQRRSGIDPRLEAICLKAMAKDPAARFATMKEFAAELEAVVRTPVPAAASAETARPDRTRGAADDPSTNATNLADVFAAMSVERKQARAETAAAVEAAVAKHRTPRWVLVLFGVLLAGGLTALGGIIFFAKTKSATVLISVDVDLSDKTLSFFLDGKPISAEELAKPVELKIGEHELIVKRGKDVVKRILFGVRGGNNPSIKIREVEEPPRKEKTPSPESEDRKFAEWLISMRVSVAVSVDGGPEREFSKLDDLPKEPFRVTRFDSWGNDRITDRTVDPIFRWIERRGIERVVFFANPVGDETARRLVKMPSVKRIGLGATKITPACIPDLATRTDLVELSLSERPIGDADIEKLRGLLNLVQLQLSSTRLTDAGLKHLRGMRNLRELRLNSTAVTGAGLDELAGMPLETIALGYTKIRGADGLARLKKLPELTVVELNGLLLGDADLKPLTDCKSIVHLGLHDNRITDAGLEHLAKMKWLRFVMLRFGSATNPVTPAGVERLRKALPYCTVVYEDSLEPKAADEQGFIPLFNGKDLTGWSTLNLNHTKTKTMSVWAAEPERHVLAAVAGDFQELQSDRLFKDFTLRLEWRFTPGRSVGVNGSGIIVRSKGLNSTGPLAGADPQGIEVDLRPRSSQSDDKGMGTGCFTTYGTTLANHRGKTKEDSRRHLGWLKEPAIHYDGEWNSCEVTCQGDRIQVSMNGDLINEGWDADQAAGRIVLRSQNTAVEFRNIRIKELEDGFAPLFNGKDLTGWQPTPGSKADWRVEGGAIVAGSAAFNPGERSYLMTARNDYADFHLRIEAMLDATADSGAFVRLQAFTQQGVSGRERGYEVQMNCEVRDTNRTGGLSVAPPAGRPVLAHRQEQGLAAAGEWFTLEVETRGARITTRVNGVVAADYTDPGRHFARGHIGLQYTRGLVKVRKVEVKELPPAGVFVPLFNGKDFAGWKNTGETAVARGWVVKDGAIVRDKANPIDEDGRDWFKNNLWTKEQYDDFILEFEFRGSGTNTLVIRADQPDHQFVDHGLHVPMNLPGTAGNYWQLGTFYPFQSPQKAARLQEGWNQLRLTAAGPNITVEVNGETINVINLDQWGLANEGKVDADMLNILRNLSRKGHIGFNAREGEISLRNIRIKKLTPAGAFVPLLNGTSLTGWEPPGPARRLECRGRLPHPPQHVREPPVQRGRRLL